MNKGLYLGFYIGSFILGVLATVLGLMVSLAVNLLINYEILSHEAASSPAFNLILGLFAFGLIQYFIVLTIYPFVLLAKMWGSIQDGVTTVTPGKAIGFLFIPFFNIYWIFKVWGGYASEYNAYAARHNLNVERLDNGIFLTYSIFVLLAGILYVPVIVLPFLLVPLIARTCDAVNSLKSTKLSSFPASHGPPLKNVDFPTRPAL